MKILIIGGTQMLGRAFVELIKEEYPDITLANRNRTNPYIFCDLKKIYIDRNIKKSCEVLNKYKYDLTIDFSCYTVDQFKNVFHNLNTDSFIYISTQSVVDKNIFSQPDLNNSLYTYAINKLNIENYIIKNLSKAIILRPCAIYGDNDYTNRFYKKDNVFFWKETGEEAKKGCISVELFCKQLKEYINLKIEKVQIFNIQ